MFDGWLQEAVNSKPADFGLGHALKFLAACSVMLMLIYPIHRLAIPLIHEGGHFLVAKATGKTPHLFIVGNGEQRIWIDVSIGGTRFVVSPKGGGSQVVFAVGQKTCPIAAGGPMATLLVAGACFVWCLRHRGKPITIMYVVVLAFGLDATISALVNLFSSLPGADGVFLRKCFSWL